MVATIKAVMVQTDHYSQDMQLEECEQEVGAFIYRYRRPTTDSPLENFVRFFQDIFGGVTKAKDSLCGRERTLPDLINIKGQKLQIARDASSNCIWGSIRDDKQPDKTSRIEITFLRPSEVHLEASKNGSQTNALVVPPPPPPPPPPPQSNLAKNLAQASSGKNRAAPKMTGSEPSTVVPSSGHNIDADTLKNRLNALKKPDQSNRPKINSAPSTESDLLKELAKKMASRNLNLNNEKLDETDLWDDKEPPSVKPSDNLL